MLNFEVLFRLCVIDEDLVIFSLNIGLKTLQFEFICHVH